MFNNRVAQGAQVLFHELVDLSLDGVVGPYNSGAGLKTLPRYLDAGLVPIRLTSSDDTAGMGFTLQPMTSQIAPVATDAVSSESDTRRSNGMLSPLYESRKPASNAMRSSDWR
jgi:ABC-type branched-subunit amino acid transport system substrate-binding protein